MTHLLALALVLQIHNLAGAPPSVIQKAQGELTRLYDEIGVHVDWHHGAAASADPIGRVHVILVPDETGDLRRGRTVAMGATVWSLNGTPVVYVFYRRVRAESERYAASIGHVLACTLAHELGHVLMPDYGHTPEGLMRAQWGGDELHRAEQGQLRFTAEDVARIRARRD
jgi:hypothetical protein